MRKGMRIFGAIAVCALMVSVALPNALADYEERLKVSTDKSQYEVGETLHICIKNNGISDIKIDKVDILSAANYVRMAVVDKGSKLLIKPGKAVTIDCEISREVFGPPECLVRVTYGYPGGFPTQFEYSNTFSIDY